MDQQGWIYPTMGASATQLFIRIYYLTLFFNVIILSQKIYVAYCTLHIFIINKILFIIL